MKKLTISIGDDEIRTVSESITVCEAIDDLTCSRCFIATYESKNQCTIRVFSSLSDVFFAFIGNDALSSSQTQNS